MTTNGRSSHSFDVEARVERPPDKRQIAVDGPVDARKPLHDHQIFELLGHGAHQRTQTGRPGAKNSAQSKLWVAGHDSRPHEESARCARRRQAHSMSGHRPTHAKALPTVYWHGWGTSRAAAAFRRARFSSWRSPRVRRAAHERRRPSSCTHKPDGHDGRSPACQSAV